MNAIILHSKVRNTFPKDKTEESRQSHNKEKYARNPIEKTSDYFNNLDEEKVCDKKKWEQENPILQITPFQMKKLAAIDNKII